ncbi:MAG: glycogen/starch synthase [Bacteroidales bacterium]|jgi:starch synthase|nr:glycogen/starch synthase [Bacteroidales bacterium]
MENMKILYVNQEMCPYTKETPLALIGRHLPQFIQEKQNDIRVFIPKHNALNERRSQLHEVIRLSGKNIVINDVDFPLIMKVASLPEAKMQIYFVDNDDFFNKKALLDRTGKPYDDADTKLIFFARGAVETTLKLSWSPDLVHCSGWFSSLLPLYIRRFYKTNPMYKDTKIVVSLFNETFKTKINKKLLTKLEFDKIPAKDIARYEGLTYRTLMKAAIDLADGVIVSEEKVDAELIAYAKKARVPLMPYKSEETFFADCQKFYAKILSK